MRRDLVIAIRIACLAKLLLGTTLLHRWLLGGDKPPTVFDTVYFQCIVANVSLCYYCVLKFCMVACSPPRSRPRRISFVPRDGDGNYLDMHISTATDIIRGTPKLTIQNVWVFVYGVGFILFVSGYCILGLNRLCLASFGLGMGTLALDELICPRGAMGKLYASARAASLMACVVSLILVSAELLSAEVVAFTSTLDLYSFGFGFCLPNVSHFLMVAVRDSRHFSLGSVIEVCEFGLPFTAFLCVFHLSVAYGQRFQIGSAGEGWGGKGLAVRTDTPFLLFFALAPFLVCPCLVAFVSCVLEGSAIDPLLAVALSLCVHYVLEKPASALGIYGTVCCAVAIAIRVLSEYQPVLGPGLHLQSESTQLTQQALWKRQNRQAEDEEDEDWESRVRQAEELTRDLQVPEEDAARA
jgi:hypothetical protein